MRQLGVSIYPEQMDAAATRTYLKLTVKYGYRRVFTSLLQLDPDGQQLAQFKAIVQYARDLGMHTIVDINPALFKELGVEYADLSFFADLGVWGLRLDEGFTGREEALMTRNEFNLKIEINMSAGTNYVQSIMSYAPNTDNLIGCHNFYPQKYTGLSDQYFLDYSRPYRQLNLHTAAFVNAPGAPLGPWPVSEGLATRESDRERPIVTQVQSLMLTGMVDDIIIGNAPATEDQLIDAAHAFFVQYPELKVHLGENVSELERTIAFGAPHLYRGDASDYMIRDTQPRVTYAKRSIPAHNATGTIHRGDVLVVNDEYGRYKGELQLALTDWPNDGRRNVVGSIADDDLVLLGQLTPWMTFNLI
jgi:hypothetical protein